jgi:cell division initiation protein
MENKDSDVSTPKLNPSDIKGKEFNKAFRGFEPQEVAEFLDRIAKSVEKAQREEKLLQKKLATLTEEVGKWKARENELVQMREKAVADAEEIRNQASKEAARMLQEVDERASSIRKSTEEWLEEVIQRLEETQRQKHSFVTALKSSLDSHYELLKSEVPEASNLGAQLTEFLQARTSANRPN